MNKIRWIIILIIFLGISAVLTFQLNHKSETLDETLTTEASNYNGEKVFLDFYIWADERSYVTPVVNAYMAFHSDVKITLHILDTEFYDEVIKELLDGDTKIDLLGVRGISLLVQMKLKKQLLDLTPYIKNNNMDVTAYGNMFNDISIDGEYYGLPTRSTSWFLLYNKDLFDEAGMDYPDQITWEEYRRLALTLTKGKGRNKVYGGYWAPWIFNFAAIQRSSYLIDDDLTYTKESLEMLNNFYNVDQSHMSYKQMAIAEDEIDYLSLFESGRIAMMPQGEWIINMLIEDQKSGQNQVNWDIAPLPVFEDQDPGITWGQYQFVSIANKSKYSKEAFQFIRFLCGEEGARIYAENGIIHAYRSDDIKEIYLKAVGKESASIFYEGKRVQEELPVPYYQEVVVAFKEYAKEYLLGNISLEEAMSEFAEKRDEIYQKDY